MGDNGASPDKVARSDRTIFISYARDDDEAFVLRMRDDLVAHGHHVWWDRASMESRGRTFLAEIRTAIEAAERVLLVVGPAAKDRLYVDVEWRHALRHGVVVTPILRLGHYSDVPSALAALHCEDVREQVPEARALARVRRLVERPVPSQGALVGVPRLPSPYIARPALLDRLLRRVLIDAYEPIDLEADQRITALTGMGGAGKSVVAAAVAQTAEVRRSFQGGVVWITVGQYPDVVTALARVGGALGSDVTSYTDVDSARLTLGRVLAGANCLVILDDLWDAEVVEALHAAAGTGVRILMTSRHRNLFASTGVHNVVVEELDDELGLELLAKWTVGSVDKLPHQAPDICAECGNLPLALSMVGAMIGRRDDRWDYALQRLRRADLTKVGANIPDYPYRDLDRAMLVSFDDLDQELQQRYLDLAVLPEDAAAPQSMLERWWVSEGADPLDVVDTLDRLTDRSLMRVLEDDRYVVHDVQRDFLLGRVHDVPALHQRWLAAFAPPVQGAWWLAPDDGYLLDHLDYHLREADRVDEWRRLLTSFEWLNRKTGARGMPVVLQDLLHQVDDRAVRVVERACRLAAHVLTNDPSQLAAQLLARLDDGSGLTEIVRLRREAAASPRRGWLSPVNIGLGSDHDPMIVAFRGRESDGHAGSPRSIALSPDLSLLASGGGSSNDLTVKLWSIRGATLLWNVDGVMSGGGRAALAFVSGEGHLAVAGDDRVSLHVPSSGTPVASAHFPRRMVSDICRGPQDGVVMIAFHDGGIERWNVSDDTKVPLRETDGQAILALAHAAAASRVVCAIEGRLECRSSEDGAVIATADVLHDVWGIQMLAVDNAGSRVWSGAPAVEWSIDAGTTHPLMPGVGKHVAITKDGRTALAIADQQSYHYQELVVLDVGSRETRGRIRNSREFSCLALADTGALVVTGDYEHDVKVWDLTRVTTKLSDWETRGPVWDVSICDDGGLALVHSEGAEEVWDTGGGRVMDAVPAAEVAERLVRRGAPLGSTLDAKQRAEMEGIVDRADRDPIERARLGPVAVSHAARRAVTAPPLPGKGPDREEPPELGSRPSRRLWVWDLDDLTAARRVQGPTGWVTSVSITDDGRRALTGSQGRLLRLWDLDSGSCLQTMRGHRGMVLSCGISDDARLAVSGSEDMTVRLWDLEAGVLLFTFATASAVRSCDISPDGRVAMAAESSGRVHVFSVR